MANLKKLKLASSCVSCTTKPCQIGCPLNNDITGFIKEIKQKNYHQAFDILSKTTILMPICGRVCPHHKQCEGSCVKGISYKPVKIGLLEATIGDLALDKKWTFTSPKKTIKKVAVIGSGPAGLTCAAFLRMNGIGVTIYEKHDYLGGLLSHGIPEFRLPSKIVKKVITNIISLGIDVKYNMELGQNLKLSTLKKEYDAIFLGIGANVSNRINVPGEELKNVYTGNELLENKISLDYQNKFVIIYGAGNVAMDLSRTAKLNGAKKVLIIYRHTEQKMSADEKEIIAAKKDGIEFLYSTKIIKINGQNELESVEVIKTKEIIKDNQNILIDIENSNYHISCDYFITAIGSHPDPLVEKLPLDKNQGKIIINNLGMTSNKKIFSGGDVAG